MTVKRGLGRNLTALLGATAAVQAEDIKTFRTLEVKQLVAGKYQPRGQIDPVSLQALSASIKQQGVLQPLVVREIGYEKYEVIAGERRWRAAVLAGLDAVPVMLRQVDDETAMAMALIENVQREDLNPVDEARAFLRLTEEFGLTHQQVADLVSKSRAAITNQLRLLQLDPAVIAVLAQGQIDMGHARALLLLDSDQQKAIAAQIIAQNWSVRETENQVKRLKTRDAVVIVEKKAATTVESPLFTEKLNGLSAYLSAKVQLKSGRGNGGAIMIHYTDADILGVILDKLTLR